MEGRDGGSMRDNRACLQAEDKAPERREDNVIAGSLETTVQGEGKEGGMKNTAGKDWGLEQQEPSHPLRR